MLVRIRESLTALVLLIAWLLMSVILLVMAAFCVDVPFRDVWHLCRVEARRLGFMVLTGKWPE